MNNNPPEPQQHTLEELRRFLDITFYQSHEWSNCLHILYETHIELFEKDNDSDLPIPDDLRGLISKHLRQVIQVVRSTHIEDFKNEYEITRKEISDMLGSDDVHEG
jgi:hypothetical protein